jgi:5,10-methylenetetrahydromethanopterin reductase
MDISCAFAPVPETPEHIALAERLRYRRAWVFDTPALQLDVWMTLARAAERTARIELGTGVLIPSLRHVVATAAAVATLVEFAPGRVNVGIGSRRSPSPARPRPSGSGCAIWRRAASPRSRISRRGRTSRGS